MKADILLFSPSTEVREAIGEILASNGYRVIPISTVMEARGIIPRKDFNLLIVEGSQDDVRELIDRVRGYSPQVQVLALADSGSGAAALNYIPEGAAGCIFKPLREAEVRFEVARVLSAKSVKVTPKTEREKDFIHHQSRNPQMAELYNAAVIKIAKSDSTVLIQGESGTGKELMASWIFSHSLRLDKPFVKVSCAVLPEGVLESELFGHEKGSFTGAYSKRKGRFELADKGTIFLDEIGEIPPSIQSKFLRVLQEREFQRVGSNQMLKVDMRVIAATSRDLQQEVKEGRFRQDLFYRLNVISLKIPPLRERREDIPFLAEMFINKYGSKSGRRFAGFDGGAMRLLTSYDWPGNVRELENVVERAVVMASGNIITSDDLPTNIIQLLSEEPSDDMTLKQARRKFEGEYIRETLGRFKGNVSRTSKYLELARKNLMEKMKRYGIEANQYRTSRNDDLRKIGNSF